MAQLTKGTTYASNTEVTSTNLNAHVDNATITNIVNADISASAEIVDTKLATISTAGKVSGAALTALGSTPSGAGALPLVNGGTGQTTLAAFLNLIYPVGSVYINVSDSTNPGTLLGFGTWSALGAGRMIVGYDSGDAAFDTAGETGGANTATLAASNIPPLPVTMDSCDNNSGAGTGDAAVEGQSANVNSTISGRASTYANLGVTAAAFSVLNKYVTCYTWKRTA